jgi:hypothetical protein
MAGWVQGLVKRLERTETTHAPRPEGENVVEIPNGLDKLRKMIVAINNEIVEAQTERAAYHESWQLCVDEVSTAYAKNLQRQRDATHRLERLQAEWVRVCHELGIKAAVVTPPIDETLPEGLATIQRRET